MDIKNKEKPFEQKTRRAGTREERKQGKKKERKEGTNETNHEQSEEDLNTSSLFVDAFSILNP